MKITKILSTAIFFSFYILQLKAQNLKIENYGFNQIEVEHDTRIDSLLHNLNINHNSENTMEISGYRVQIYFGSERSTALEVKTSFLRQYPDTYAYLLYQQPNFKVRVGDFRSQEEAANFIKSIKDNYLGAFVVRDIIRYRASAANFASDGF